MERAVETTRRGTERRQRTAAVFVRFTPAEFATLSERAEAAELSAAGFLRHAALGTRSLRARRQPAANLDVLRRLLGAVGKLGANVNQLAAASNRGALPDGGDIHAAAADIRMLRAQIITALGREP